MVQGLPQAADQRNTKLSILSKVGIAAAAARKCDEKKKRKEQRNAPYSLAPRGSR